MLLSTWLSVLVGCSADELGTEGNPVKFYFTPSSDAERIADNSREMMDFLEKETGLVFETGIPTSYVAVVEAFGSERADVAVMNSFGYLMAHERYGAEAHLTALRYGTNTYQGMIVTRADSGITDLAGLSGSKFAFTDPSSTSGYLFPLAMMKRAGVQPAETVFAGKHDAVITMVYQGQVQAGSAFYSPPDANGKIRDARSKVVTQFPDVETSVVVLAQTDPILNDPFVFRKGVPEEIKVKVVKGIQRFLESEEGRASFERTYNFEGVVEASDAAYDGMRQILEAAGVKAEDLAN